MSNNPSQDKIYLTDYEKGFTKQEKYKETSAKISYFYDLSPDANLRRYGNRVEACANWVIGNLQENKFKVKKITFCKVRLCPVCQWYRSRVLRGRLFKKLPDLLSQKKNLEFLFLTLTVKNCEIANLAEVLSEMNEAWRRLRVRKEFQKGIKGFIRATEVTKGKDGSAHPHFHCILAVEASYFKKDYISADNWCELWRSCLNIDYLPVVDIRKIRRKGDKLDPKAVLETLKYTTKVTDLLDDRTWFLELTKQLSNKRFFATGGIFKDVLKDDSECGKKVKVLEDEEMSLEELEELKKDLYFNWKEKEKKYKKVKNPYLD